LAPERGRVPVVYRYRDLALASGVVVRNVLVPVDEATDEVLAVPAQSTPRLREAREAAKEETLEVRIPRELEDVLVLLAAQFGVAEKKFSPALIRYYLHLATSHRLVAKRLSVLSRDRLAQGKYAARLKVRWSSALSSEVAQLVKSYSDASQSDLVRGAILAAKEDVLERRERKRLEQLEAVAAAV